MFLLFWVNSQADSTKQSFCFTREHVFYFQTHREAFEVPFLLCCIYLSIRISTWDVEGTDSKSLFDSEQGSSITWGGDKSYRLQNVFEWDLSAFETVLLCVKYLLGQRESDSECP